MSHYKGDPDNGALVSGCSMMIIVMFMVVVLIFLWGFGAGLRGM